MIDFENARLAFLKAFAPLGHVRVPLGDAAGRRCATTIAAPHDWPMFDNSAMDGYAIDPSSNIDESTAFEVVAEVAAGQTKLPTVGRGQAARVFTGAPMPIGTDTVVMQEYSRREGTSVRFTESVKRGQHVRRRGNDISEGQTLLEPSTLLGPAELSVLASMNLPSVHLFRRPSVAILSTGDELQSLGRDLGAFQVIDSNRYAISAALRGLAEPAIEYVRVPDSLTKTIDAIERCHEHDLVISVGGASVGDHDHVGAALDALGFERLVDGIALKPGKPTMLARLGKTLFVGLPGNPVSALVVFEAFVRPALESMLGNTGAPVRRWARARGDIGHRPGRVELVRGRLEHEEAGFRFNAVADQNSGALSSLLGVNALGLIPRDSEGLRSGEELEVLPFNDPSGF
ncbi:MAG: molybdopterin molybdotransferase MoeA [Polyangiales bacterium]